MVGVLGRPLLLSREGREHDLGPPLTRRRPHGSLRRTKEVDSVPTASTIAAPIERGYGLKSHFTAVGTCHPWHAPARLSALQSHLAAESGMKGYLYPTADKQL